MERSARAWWLSESRRAPRRVSGGPPQNAAVADAARETVCVEPLEQELGVTSAGAREIAKASERDLARAPALGEQKILRRLVRVDPDRIAVAEPNEASGRLEVARKRVFADLRRPRTCARELAFERTCFFLASAERRDGTALDERHPPRVAVARWRGIEDDSSAESRLPADDHMIAAGRNHRRRKAQLGPALAGSNDTSRHVRRSEMCKETRPVSDRPELVERDVEPVGDRVRARGDECVTSSYLATLETGEAHGDALPR